MSGERAVAETPIALSGTTSVSTAVGLFADPSVTIISQYANSPIITQLVQTFAEWLDPNARLDDFYNLVWNVDTAQGYGLDVWGRIVGVGRVLQVPVGGFLGFSQDAQAQTFGNGVWYAGGALTSNYALTDVAYRQLILAKAALNITDCSIPAINRILLNLFGEYGDCYVRDNLDMTISYRFPSTLSPLDFAIVSQSGVLPRPAGVSYTVVQS